VTHSEQVQDAVFEAPLRRIAFGPATAIVDRREDGSLLLRSTEPLRSYPRRFTERLFHWAAVAPSRVFLAQRAAGGHWRELTYAEAAARVRAIGQALLDRRLSADRPVAILSGNDIEHALLALAAMHVGVLYAPISPAYSLVSSDHERLKYIVGLLNPGMVFADSGARYARAIGAAVPQGVECVFTRDPVEGRHASAFSALEANAPGPEVDRAHEAVGPDHVAKILFTSGSTGQPKGVINTQRMLCHNQQMILQSLPHYGEVPPVLVDWLPWHHTAGGNNDFGLIVNNGGTLYIDEGRPQPDMIEPTVRNLREIATTAYISVPRGYEALLPYLHDDAALREKFFSRLGFLFYAGAALSQPVWKAYDELAVRTCGERIAWITSLGSTETAPFAMCTSRGAARAAVIGLPSPGVELKLAPVEGKLEARFRGPSITPGYWRRPDLTQAAFDEEGFYRMGDAMRFIDPDAPELGLEFDGRLAEDFKLATATWVRVGPLRLQCVAAGVPYVQDVVIAGEGRDDIAVLVFPNLAACRKLCPALPETATAGEIVGDPAVRAWFQALFDRLGREATGSSNRIARALLLEHPPALDRGEVTDKGSLNQRAVLEHRAALVEELYAAQPSPRLICTNFKEKTR
jgi:feruloyl-CoA synthase